MRKKEMSVWSGKQVAKFLTPLNEDQINPNGVDLRVLKILVNKEAGALLQHKRKIPTRTEVEVTEGTYTLEKGPFIVVYKEKVRIPEDAIGLVFPRSSLMRMGVRLHSAVWDSGYEGRGEGLLVVHNEKGVEIEKLAKIGQIIFLSATESGKYSGRYQQERLSDFKGRSEKNN